jgi:hypothetical protein
MAKSNKEWSEMTAEERKQLTAEQRAKAISACGPNKFPTGLTVTIGGKEYIARPVRVTDSGGVTYGINARPLTVGKYAARFNKFSLTLGVGESAAEVSFDEESENLL